MNGLSYLLQVNLYLLIFYLFYLALLRNETFFKLNRVYLIGTSLLALLIPVLQSEWIKSLFVTGQVYTVTQNLNAAILVGSQHKLQDQSWSVLDILSTCYYAGIAVIFIRFLLKLHTIKQLLLKPGKSRAFSFFNSIIIDETYAEKATILKHEQVHAKELHSADILFYELLAIFNWFNPVVYAYKKAIRFIHEFIADENAVAGEKDKSAYAMLLLSNTFGLNTQTLTNNFFNQSLLKRRIMMLHKTRSKRAAILKYGLSAPLFAAMVIFSSATIKESATAETLTQVTEVKASNLPEIINKLNTKTISKKYKSKKSTSARDTSVSLYEVVIDNNSASTKRPLKTKQDTALQEDKSIHNFASIDVLPEYPGGMRAFYEYIGHNYKAPDEAKKAGISGRVNLNFIVEKDGSLSNIRILRDLGMGTGEEAVRVLAASQKWKPGIQNGKPVRVSYTLPILLNLDKRQQESKKLNQKIEETIKEEVTLIPPPADTTNKPVPPPPPPLPPQALYLLNGKEIKFEKLKDIAVDNIQSLKVWKDKEAIERYGEKGRNGVVVITTGNVSTGAKDLSYKHFNGLLIIDGKETDNTLLKAIDPKKIESAQILKGDEAVKVYGSKGKNGVILITTKKNP